MSDRGSDERYLGIGSRLTAGPSRDLANTAFAFELESAPYLWQHLGQADRAHTAALVAARVIDRIDGVKLLGALDALDEMDPASLGLDPYLGDVHNNRDVLLSEAIGETAGVLNTARARREATTIAWQLACRERLADFGLAISDLVSALVSVAQGNIDSLMPDFTYLHHAHPTTLAHYLLGFAYPLVRTLERVNVVLALVNRSPAGSGSVNGSPIPIDRQLLARLLEFDGLVVHTRDAMWAPDMALQQMNVVVDLAVTIDRLAEDLQLWTTEEFGFVELADEHCRTSVIMPQKKNPYSLAYARGVSRAAIGTATGVAATMMTPSGQPDNRIFSYVEVPAALDRFSAVSRLLAAVLVGTRFDLGRMRNAAASGHTYATDLCDLLVTDAGIDNRTAHKIVGSAIRQVIESGTEYPSAELLSEAAEGLGHEIDLSEALVAAAMDLDRIIAVRTTIGGAAPISVARMIAELQERIQRAVHPLVYADPEEFDQRLRAEASRLLANQKE